MIYSFMTIIVDNIIRKYQATYYPVVPFNPATQVLAPLNLTGANTELTYDIFNDTELFTAYIDAKRKNAGASYLIGGYNELREVYGRSELFNGDEPRRLHLGTDIWGPSGTPVSAPLGGMVHSFAFNNHYGDYGATLILLHQLDGFPFYTLYGHLSLKDIENISAGQYVNRGQKIAHFGQPHENGHWPPHLHFQIIYDLELYEGDYPGVCKYSEREKYLYNCPDPDVVLQMDRYI
jgi:peptidoglycan LD-endopeptidase LytH